MKTILIRGGMIAAGIGVMWWEGTQQPSPGIGFALAMALMLGAAISDRIVELSDG